METAWVGIDLSLTSPGLAVYCENTLNLYFYASRKKDVTRKRQLTCQWNGKTIECLIQPFERQIVDETILERYKMITEDIVGEILKYPSTKIRMEGYAFDAKSSSISKLHELGGILKYLLYNNGRQFAEVPPTRLKKWFTGSGRASKELMYEHFILKGLPPLIEIFEMEKCKGIPNPVQDIVDAFALVHSFLEHETK
jgi:Holliday junction resolvasome RuvABC endonuclease subunit